MALKTGYSRKRSGGKTTYTDKSGKKVSASEATSSGGKKSSSSSSSSGSSSSNNSRAERTAELQKAGISRAEAASIALAESKGQKITGLSANVASKVSSGKISSSAIQSKEVSKIMETQSKVSARKEEIDYRSSPEFKAAEERYYSGAATSSDLITLQQRTAGSGVPLFVQYRNGDSTKIISDIESQKKITAEYKEIAPKIQAYNKQEAERNKESKSEEMRFLEVKTEEEKTPGQKLISDAKNIGYALGKEKTTLSNFFEKSVKDISSVRSYFKGYGLIALEKSKEKAEDIGKAIKIFSELSPTAQKGILFSTAKTSYENIKKPFKFIEEKAEDIGKAIKIFSELSPTAQKGILFSTAKTSYETIEKPFQFIEKKKEELNSKIKELSLKGLEIGKEKAEDIGESIKIFSELSPTAQKGIIIETGKEILEFGKERVKKSQDKFKRYSESFFTEYEKAKNKKEFIPITRGVLRGPLKEGITDYMITPSKYISKGIQYPIEEAKKVIPDSSQKIIKGTTEFGLSFLGPVGIMEGLKLSEKRPITGLGVAALEFFGFKILEEAPELVKGAKAISTGKLFEPVTDSLGVRKVVLPRESTLIGRAKSAIKKSSPIAIEFVPEGKVPIKDVFSRADPLSAALNLIPESKFISSPKIPKETTSIQRELLNLVKDTPETYAGGSFAQKVLIKESRSFKDIDIVTGDPLEFALEAGRRLGNKIEIFPQDITIGKDPFTIYRVTEKGSKKVIADIDPIAFAEEGGAKIFGSTVVEGIPILDIRARLFGKVGSLKKGKITKKAIGDIESLTGRQLAGQSIEGAYGLSFKDQAKFVGKKGDIITAQRSLFGKLDKEITVTKPGEGIEEFMFFSPFDIKTGAAQLRTSRLGLDKTTFIDRLMAEGVGFRQTPQALILQQEKIADIAPELIPLYKKALKDPSYVERFSKEYFEKQQKIPTGKIDPFGYVGASEAELTLAKGEIIRKKGILGYFKEQGRVIEVIDVEIAKPSKKLLSMGEKIRRGTPLTKEESKLFKQLYETETKGLTKIDILKKDKGYFPTISSKVNDIKKISPLDIGYKGLRSTISKISRIDPNYIQSVPKITPSYSPSIKQSISSYSPSITTISPSYSPSYPSPSSPSPNISSGISITPDYESSPSYSPSYPSPSSPRPPEPEPPKKRIPELKFEEDRKVKGYNAYVKESGKFVKVTKNPVSRDAAFRRADYVVDNTAAATFKVVKTNKKVKPLSQPAKSFFQKNNYRGIKKKGKSTAPTNKFIERNKYRIDTRGELDGITVKGLQSLERKRRSLF